MPLPAKQLSLVKAKTCAVYNYGVQQPPAGQQDQNPFLASKSCGVSAGTKNPLHEEMLCQGDDSQYNYVSEMKPLQVPDLDYLSVLGNVKASSGVSDFLDALIVALDQLIKAVDCRKQGKASKRIILLSNFLCEVCSG